MLPSKALETLLFWDAGTSSRRRASAASSFASSSALLSFVQPSFDVVLFFMLCNVLLVIHSALRHFGRARHSHCDATLDVRVPSTGRDDEAQRRWCLVRVRSHAMLRARVSFNEVRVWSTHTCCYELRAHAHPKKGQNERKTTRRKKKYTIWESNPGHSLGRRICCHYTNSVEPETSSCADNDTEIDQGGVASGGRLVCLAQLGSPGSEIRVTSELRRAQRRPISPARCAEHRNHSTGKRRSPKCSSNSCRRRFQTLPAGSRRELSCSRGSTTRATRARPSTTRRPSTRPSSTAARRRSRRAARRGVRRETTGRRRSGCSSRVAVPYIEANERNTEYVRARDLSSSGSVRFYERDETTAPDEARRRTARYPVIAGSLTHRRACAPFCGILAARRGDNAARPPTTSTPGPRTRDFY